MHGSLNRYLRAVGLPIAWLVIFIVFTALLPTVFPTSRNIETMIRQTVIVGFASVGMTFIIITGAIDLSVGSLVALVTVVIAWCLKAGYSPAVAASLGILAGALGGFVNGFLTTRLRVGAFIVTLATLLAFRGVAKGIAKEQTIRMPETWLSGLTSAVPDNQKWMIFPPGVWLMIACALVSAFILRQTVFGKHVIATGSSEPTARMCGVNTRLIQLLAFTLAGIFFGLSGLMQFSRLTIGDPTVAQGLELSVIAAVVIGGASLSGGEGSIFGALVGAFIMNTIATGASQLGWPNWIQEIVTGAIIVIAVALDRWRIARAAEKGGA
jgi:ribose transport system permease protein